MKQLEQIAYHEAGHAAISILSKRKIYFPEKCTIEPDGKRLGYVCALGFGWFILYNKGDKKDYRICKDYVDWLLKITAAGRIAEDLFFLLKHYRSDSNDLLKYSDSHFTFYKGIFEKHKSQDALDFNFICDKFYKRKTKDHIYSDIFKTTEKLLLKNWDLVVCIVNNLLKEKTLNKNEMINIYNTLRGHKKRKIYRHNNLFMQSD